MEESNTTSTNTALNEEYNSWLLVAGAFVVLSTLITARHIFYQVHYYTHPNVQKAVIRILLMVPVYSIGSWLSLYFDRYSMYLDLIRDCYESFVIYSFVAVLIEYAGGEVKLLETLEKHPKMHHMFPFNFLPHFKLDRRFLHICKQVVLQYVLIKPITASLAILLDEMDLYDEGKFSLDKGYLYIMIVNNLSVTFAMYGLLYFYHAIQDDLKHIGPLSKLLCIKAVLFLSFWQGIAISGLAHFGIVHRTTYSSLEKVETELQDFLICFEMLFAALAHGYAYSHREFVSIDAKRVPLGSKLKDILSVSDLIRDIQRTFITRQVGFSEKKTQ